MERREIIKGALAAGVCTLFGTARGQSMPAGVRQLTTEMMLVDAAGTNLLAYHAADGLIVVDSGPASYAATLKGLMANAPTIRALFNTHYHLDQTGNNEMFAAAGAKIIAHERTRQWMSNDTWVPSLDRYEKARAKGARPTEAFQTAGSMKAGNEPIDYGYLPLAHTSGDIYVHFKTANVLAVGDVASPLRDPALDYFTGAWIGARVDAMDTLLAIANDGTRIVPAAGPVMTKAEFKAERDMMEEVRARLFKQVREGDGPKDMLAAGVLSGLARAWKDPEKFLHDAAKGLWGHHNKLDPNVV